MTHYVHAGLWRGLSVAVKVWVLQAQDAAAVQHMALSQLQVGRSHIFPQSQIVNRAKGY